MNTYIAILRGINVSGQKSIKMQELRNHLEKLDFDNVKTYIQSGNIVFKADKSDVKKIENDIVKCIKDNFGFDVPVIIRKYEEWSKVIEKNPFLGQNGVELNKLHVVFLEKRAEEKLLKEIRSMDFSPDEYEFNDKEIYLHCPNGYAKTKLSNNFFEKKLKQKATTRNWKTANKILEIANDL